MATTEELRTKQIESCDQILSANWIAQRTIEAEGRRLAHTNRTFWQQATTEDLTRLLDIYNKESSRSAEASACPGIRGSWMIYGQEPGDTEVRLIFMVPSQQWDKARAEAEAQELRDQGYKEVKVDFEIAGNQASQGQGQGQGQGGTS